MKWICLDVETTGLDLDNSRVVELAYTTESLVGEVIVRRFNPGVPIPAEASEVHGIFDSDVLDEPSIASFLPLLSALVRSRFAIGYNVGFDLSVLDSEFRRATGDGMPNPVGVIDCYEIFCNEVPRTLEGAVSYYFGRGCYDFHSARDDVRATLAVVGEQLTRQSVDDVVKYPGVDFADFGGKLRFTKDGVLVWGFGKYKGEPVVDYPGYAKWVLRSDFSEAVKEMIREEVGFE